MTILFLHVGLHKTGTSAIQMALSQNTQWLHEHGYLYPPPDSVDAHHTVVSGLLQSATDPSLGKTEFLRQLKEWWNSAERSGVNILISSEMFSEGIDFDFMRTLSAQYPMRVIIYLRRQDLLAESAYNQILKQTGVVIADIVSTPPYHLNLLGVLSRWSSIVGEQNLIVRLYGIDKSKENWLVEDFLNALGIGDQAGFSLVKDTINESLGLIEFRLLEEIAPYLGKDFIPLVKYLRSRIRNVAGNNDIPMVGNYLTVSQRQAIMNSVNDGNERIRKQFFPEREQLFPPISNDVEHRIISYSWAKLIAHECLEGSLIRDVVDDNIILK